MWCLGVNFEGGGPEDEGKCRRFHGDSPRKNSPRPAALSTAQCKRARDIPRLGRTRPKCGGGVLAPWRPFPGLFALTQGHGIGCRVTATAGRRRESSRRFSAARFGGRAGGAKSKRPGRPGRSHDACRRLGRPFNCRSSGQPSALRFHHPTKCPQADISSCAQPSALRFHHPARRGAPVLAGCAVSTGSGSGVRRRRAGSA